MAEQPHPDVRAAHFEGALTLVNERLGNVTALLGMVQQSQTDQSKMLGELTRGQIELQSRASDTARLSQQIADLATSFETWKVSHEKDNDTVADELLKYKSENAGAIKATRWAIGILGSVIAIIFTLAGALVNEKAQNLRDADRRIEIRQDATDATVRANTSRIDQTLGRPTK